MKIETFLRKINYKVLSGEIYNGHLLKNKLLYWIHFTDKHQQYKGKLLISAIDQKIYYIEYNNKIEVYIYQDELIQTEEVKNQISLKKMLSIIEK